MEVDIGTGSNGNCFDRFVKLKKLKNKLVLVVCNLKKKKDNEVVILYVTRNDKSFEFFKIPEQCNPGEKIKIKNYHPKVCQEISEKSIFTVLKKFRTNEQFQVCYDNINDILETSAGAICCNFKIIK